VSLALKFRFLKLRALILCLFGGTTCSVGIILATRSGIGRLSAVTAAACYMLFLGTQTLLTAILLYREFERKNLVVQA
jgi:hypothetical protein